MHLQTPLSEAGFISACNKNLLIKKACKILGFNGVSVSLLKKYSIKSAKGRYNASFSDVYNALSDNGKILIQSAQLKIEKESTNKKYAVKMAQFIRSIEHLSTSDEVRRFLLAILSDTFLTDVEKIRSKHEIPAGGFETSEAFLAWAGYVGKDGSAMHPALVASKFFIKGRPDKWAAAEDDFEKMLSLYKPAIAPALAHTYFFHGLNLLDLLAPELNKETSKASVVASTPGQIFDLHHDKWHDFTEELKAKSFRNPQNIFRFTESIVPTPDGKRFFIHIEIKRGGLPVEKLRKLLDKPFLQKIVREYKKYGIEQQRESQEFQNHWLFYFLHKRMGLSRIEIKKIAGGINLTQSAEGDTFRKTINRFKTKIEQSIKRDN